MRTLQKRIDYVFGDQSLLLTALTHTSWLNEHHMADSHNERLEFLGDAVLELVISSNLFVAFPKHREGELTRFRSALVNEGMLATLAQEIKLDALLRLGKGEEAQGGRKRNAVLADALEALFGAIYLDGGFFAARRVIEYLYTDHWPKHTQPAQTKDYKTQLQEHTQRLCKALPVYSLMKSQGPEHAKSFTSCVALPDGESFSAEGPSLKRAEQKAAQKALEQWTKLEIERT